MAQVATSSQFLGGSILQASSRFRLSEFDKSQGRVHILRGDFYYSPNSNREVTVPVPHSYGGSPFIPPCLPNGRQNLWQLDTSVYEQPQWWSDHYGWIAFYDKKVLDTTSALFRPLRNSAAQYTFTDGVGYTLPHWQADELLRLDNQLDLACAALRNHYRLLGLPPRNPWAFGYLRPHSKRGILSLCLEKSRRWFLVWLCLMSYLIAGSEAQELLTVTHPVVARQRWKDLLVVECADAQIDQTWIDLFLDSTVASFSPVVSRTGTFVSLTPGSSLEDENKFQPSIEWFLEYGVPIWYRWDKDLDYSNNLRHLAPLPFQFQEALAFVQKHVSPPTLPTAETTVVPSANDSWRRVSTVQMDQFFKLRDERTARLKEQETPQQRAIRLSREKQPPTVKTRVFEWTSNCDGEYVCEELTTKGLRQQALDYYRGDQLRYNAVLNEWHACELWDDFGDSDDDPDDPFPSFWGEDIPPQDPPPCTQSYDDNTLLDDAWTHVGTDSEQPQANRRALQLQEEIVHVATLYFGYTPCVPLPIVKPLEREQEQKNFCRSFGLIWDQVKSAQNAFTFPAVSAVVDFFQRLAKGVDMMPEEWDLFDTNRQAVKATPRFQLFRPVFVTSPKSTLYMLDLEPKAIAPWKLAVKKASDALMICRLDPNFNEYHIVDFLLTNGIAFHTLQPSRSILRSPQVPRPSLTPLTRVNGYKFGTQDYLTYREHCHAVLNHPRGRAALMHGHFMWRIAFRSVMWEAVYNGPSGWSPDPDEMVVVRDTSTGTEYVDDKLSAVEQEALCGTYHLLTGNGNQFAISSWHMPPHMFEKSTSFLGRWSSHTESQFLLLDQTFTNKTVSITRGPLSRDKWNDRARSSLKDIKNAHLRLEATALKLM